MTRGFNADTETHTAWQRGNPTFRARTMMQETTRQPNP